MSKVSAILVAGATSFMLSACADDFNVKEITSGGFGFKDSYDTASATQPMGSDFNKNLYSGYMDLAAAERSEYDWRDSGYFSSKALSAAQDQTVTPDSIASRDLPEESVAELAGAHAQLTAALQGGAATRAPSDAAKAQVSFDCWIQEQEENHQPEDWLACRESFNQAMARLKGVGGNNYVVFFDFDSSVPKHGESLGHATDFIISTIIWQLHPQIAARDRLHSGAEFGQPSNDVSSHI